VLTLLLFASGPLAFGNPLDFVLWQDFPGLRGSDGQWADFDNDGDLDVVTAGRTSEGDRITKTYENRNGTLVFRQDLIGVESVDSTNLDWGDYDGDGDLDLALAGQTTGDVTLARIYTNDGSGNLSWDTAQELTAVGDASVAWGDYDNDGDLDLVIIGLPVIGEPNPISVLYRNHPPGSLSIEPSVSLRGLRRGSADWGDYDSDGDLDLLLTGYDGSHRWTILYENGPAGTLTDVGNLGLPMVSNSHTAWGDYDNDGDLDLGIVGGISGYGGESIARVYRNDGAFVLAAHLMDVYGGSCAWGDYDNDGDLDVAFCGYTSVYIYTRIFRNTGAGFSLAYSMEPVTDGSLTWADADRDGDLDFFLMGTYYGWHERRQLYRNDGGLPNTAPAAPTDLICDSAGGGLHLSWSGASDAETPTAGLYYCLRVGTSPGAHDVMSGTYGTPLMGNVHQATDWVLNVPSGTYYWSVRTIDSGFMASPWSEEMVCEYDYCEGDITGDGMTDQTDLGILLALWGNCEDDPNYDPRADLDGDGCIGHGDLGVLLADWGCGSGL